MKPTPSLPLYALALLASFALACRSSQPRNTNGATSGTTSGASPTARATDADVPAPLPNGRLPDIARPTRYALDLTVNPDDPGYSGVVRIDVELARATRAVVLHARGLSVTRAEITQGEGRQTATTVSRMAAGGRESEEELVLVVPRALGAGRATLEVAYTGSFSPDLRGLFHVRENERWYAFSDFEPTDARRAFPCFDEPGFKVPVEVSITAPTEMAALSNMNEVSHSDDAQRHTTTHRFAPSPPMPTYLVSFAVGPFDFHQGPPGPVPIRVVTTRGKASLGQLAGVMANETLAYLGDWFQRPYPYPKLDLVAVPDFGPGAMENPGLVTFRDAALLLDEYRASVRARYYMSSIVAHELAHQWFGDLVTMAWWDDLWLNEGFATWMATKVMRRLRPATLPEYDEVESTSWARNTDGLTTAHAIRQRITSTSEAVESFDATTYSKGAAVLRMLETWMGEEVFQRGIREYIRAHEWGNATAAELLAALSTAAGRDVSPVATSFLDQAGVPLLRVEVSCDASRKPQVTFTQSRFALDPPPQPFTERWQIPVCYRYQDPSAPRNETCVLLTDERTTVTLENARVGHCPQWVDPDVRVSGYYWYQLPPAMWRPLLGGSLGDRPTARLNLLANLGALLDAGVVPADVYLDVIARLVPDRDPAVSERAIGRLWSVEHTFVTDATRPAFRAWVTALVRPIALRLGWNPRPNEPESVQNLRRTALAAMGTLTEDPAVQREAEAIAQRYLRDMRSVTGDVAGVALPIASRRADASRFDAIVARLSTAATPQDRALLLGSLVTFDDVALVRRAYDLILTDTVRLQDLRALTGRTGATPAHRTLLLEWSRAHVDDLQRKLGRSMRFIIGAIGPLCDEAAVADAERFMRERLGHLEGTDRNIALSANLARRCAVTRRREAERATAFFARVPGR